MSATYPLFLNMRGRRCVVVGGGKVAARKTRSLLTSGAEVRVVAPEIGQEMAAMVEAGLVGWEARGALDADVDAADLVFLASSDPGLQRRLADRARLNGALVNQADLADGGDFQVPAVVRQGDVTVAISTGGRSPAFARMLREEIETTLDTDRLLLLEVMAEARERAHHDDASASGESWDRAVDTETRALVQRGERELAVQRVTERLREKTASTGTE